MTRNLGSTPRLLCSTYRETLRQACPEALEGLRVTEEGLHRPTNTHLQIITPLTYLVVIQNA